MHLLVKLVRRPIEVAACAVALVVLAQLNLGSASAAAPVAAPGLLATVGGTPYLNAVGQDNPTNLWRLNDTVTGTSLDSAGSDNLTMDASVTTRGTAGPMSGENSVATTFSGAGSGTVPATTARQITGPQSFSLEAWFKTTSTVGGKIIGFGGSKTGNSLNYDRHIFMTNAGNLTFGVYPTTYRYLTSPLAYNNGQWHHVVASMNSSGMDLFVDGRRVAHDSSTAGAELFSGYWRVGGDNVSSWPGVPTKFSFGGALADVAVYPAPLSLARVKSHYVASGRSVDPASSPADAYGAAVVGDSPSLYWRLNEKSGLAAKDEVSGDTTSGVYTTGTVLGEPGSSAAPTGTSIRFPGGSAQSMVSTMQVSNPTVFSLETWFKSTSSQGGRLIGFGSAQTGESSNYDRHVYLLDNGRLRYGIYGSTTMNIDSPQSYNDGQWHHVVATQGSAGQQLFVDGTRVATSTDVTGQSYLGYWRLGTDRTWSGATSDSLAGSLDEVAVYPTVLSAATVQQHHQLGQPIPPNQPPAAVFTSTTAKLKVDFDATGSTDTDGTIAGYAWDFGDGTSGTGATPAHTYPATGTYTVVLTVKDNQDATALVTRDIIVTANAAPSAAFSSNCTDLVCVFDATAAADSDGSVATYEWDFGDGTTGTGVSLDHVYQAGTYTVTLVVTDDDGASGTIRHDVTPVAPNRPPVARFTSVVTDLSVALDASGSTDVDGTLATYAWTFGDGKSAAGVRPTHQYAAPGTYRVSLTVTDDDGATDTTSASVTATSPIVAADTFTRTVSSGLGTAEIGGPWTIEGSSVTASVVDGTGRISVGAARMNTFMLNSVSSLDTDLVHTLWLEEVPRGAGGVLWTVVRSSAGGDYRGRLIVSPSGGMTARLVKFVDGSQSTLATSVPVPGEYVAHQKLRIRVQAFGATPTTVRMKIWPAIDAEPVDWLITTTDSTPGLQVPGAVGAASNLSSSTVIRLDDLVATERTDLATSP